MMRTAIVFLRFLFPLLVGGAIYALGAGPAWSVGLLLLAAALLFPVVDSGRKPTPCRQILNVTCPQVVRKWIYPFILFCGLFFGFFAMLENSSDPDSWRYDRFELDLRNNPALYRRKIKIQADYVRINCNSASDSVVEADGKILNRTEDRQKFQSNPKEYYFGSSRYIDVSSDYGKITVRIPRKIVGVLSNPYWLRAVLLLISFWISLCEWGLLPAAALPVRKPEHFLLVALSVIAVTVVFYRCGSGQQIQPLIYTNDSIGYLDLATGNPVRNSLLSERTPGYPVFLNLMFQVSPASHFAVLAVQSAFYFLSLGWLLYELNRVGMPSVCCVVLMILFLKYMEFYHRFLMADSLGLSGIILLLAFGTAWFRSLASGCSGRRQACWYLAGALLIFVQLMIKPFPGTIFIPGGLVFLMFIFAGNPKTAFRHALGFSLSAMILPLLFCSFRYWKTGDFNFASVSSFQMCSTAIILHDPAKTAQLDAATRRDLESIVKETLKANPKLVWPIDLDRLDSPADDYVDYAAQFMYHPGLQSGSWLRDKTAGKDLSEPVRVELACKKLLVGLLPAVDRKKFLQLQQTYLRQLGSYLRHPELTAPKFAQNSPFGKSSRVLFLFLVPVSVALYLGRCKRKNGSCVLPDYNFQLMFLLVSLAFLGACGTISTFVLVTPFIEVRREMIGLFSIFFGAFGLIVYSFCFMGISLINGLIRNRVMR